MFLSEQLQQKWATVLDHPDLPEIKENYKRQVTAVLLENQEKALREERSALLQETPANNASATAGIGTYDPILIGLVRRAMPNLMAYDIAGVQPMNGPTGLIFAMRSFYGTDRAAASGTEALYNEADTDFSGTGTHSGTISNILATGSFTTGTANSTANMEAAQDYNQMSFGIDKTTVTAKSRALKAEYTVELAQDLKAIHGLDAEAELSNILSQEFMFEIKRTISRLISNMNSWLRMLLSSASASRP